MSRRRNANVRPFPVQEDPLLEWLAWLMDESVRIGPWSIGLDGFLGLIPGIGDMTGAAVSTLMIARAMQSGIPRSAIVRMVINVGVDSLLGALPLVGDIFDFAYKSNVKNLQIYREALRGARRPARDWGFIVLIFTILLAFFALPIVGLFYLAKFVVPYLPLR
jgi:hypothetical protein